MSDLPSTNVNPMDTFQADVIKKLRESIRDMLPDEVLREMVQKAVTKEFFEPTKTKNPNYRNSYSSDPEFFIGPSWFAKEVVEQCKPIMKAAIDAYVVQQTPELEKAIGIFLEQNNLMLLALSTLQMKSYSVMGDFANLTAQMIVRTMRSEGVLRS